MSDLAIPELSLVCLVGASGSGKSTFASTHFGRFEVISSDFCRGLVADDENDQSATKAAFEVLHHIAGKRLDAGRLTVVDATNVQPESRRALVALAREHDVLPTAIVLDLPERVCVDRTEARADRDFGAAVVRRQRDQLRRSLSTCRRRASARSTCSGARRRSRPRSSSGRSSSTTTSTSTVRSTSSETSTAAERSWRTFSSSSAGRWSATSRADRSMQRTQRAARQSSSGISLTEDRTPQACSAW